MDHGQFDLIIFDCDGVLVDSELLSCQCLSDELSVSGISLTLAQALDLFLGRSTSAVTQHYLVLGQTLPVDFPLQLKSRVLAAFEKALRPVLDVETVLSGLRMPYCVASSSDLDRVSLSLDVTGLRAHFGDRIYSAQMVRHGKPAPDLFLHAAEQMGAQPARTLVIEDSASGVQAGKAAGMTVWGFVGGSHYRGRDGQAILSGAGADRVFARMLDFWKDA
jgi:HAD superfamily hydrolase (TIGR01509 family)